MKHGSGYAIALALLGAVGCMADEDLENLEEGTGEDDTFEVGQPIPDPALDPQETASNEADGEALDDQGVRRDEAGAGPSIASSSRCTVISGGCTTGAVPHHNHSIIWNIATGNFGCDYLIRDVRNGVVVKRGFALFVNRGTLTGLFSSYQLSLFNCLVPGATAIIFGG